MESEGYTKPLYQVKKPRSEASTFVKLLELKRSEENGWNVFYEVNEDSRCLERVFWMSRQGLSNYKEYHDVIEMTPHTKPIDSTCHWYWSLA
jgi:hypothetical protein